ncbi:uncharacterized protein LOC132281167 [Cornus florida]|uniref:uncharacterized protein LOC132281167 n=1 Tax=Cornus florida TaxID=4283 RepID=UPI00289F5D83|nr:uncharacterized protein LOC132281167 [Cornus florida]
MDDYNPPPKDKDGWISVAKKTVSKPTPSQPNKWFVVFAGHHPGIYATWNDCHKQLRSFNGSCFKAYDTLIEAQTVFYNVGQASQKFFSQTPDAAEINNFYDPGLPNNLYDEINNVWKTHKLGANKKFRQHLSSLTALITEQTAMNDELKKLCIQICLTIDWEKDFLSLR